MDESKIDPQLSGEDATLPPSANDPLSDGSVDEASAPRVRPASASVAPASDQEPWTGDSTIAIQTTPPSSRAGRYAMKKFLARGGMGEVWMAQDTEIGRLVAVKSLRAKRSEMRERFLIEAQITGQLEHPGIVPVHDLAVGADGAPLYVMKLVYGRTLKKAVEEFHGDQSLSPTQRRVAWTRLLETFVAVCHAIAYAHARGVVHRDLKPDNVMLGPFGETVVLDWGLAKVLTHEEDQPQATDDPAYGRISGVRSSTETQAGSVVGTVTYMSPEAAEGLIEQIDESSDVFLLGATLFHLLTGEPPRKGSNPSEIVELAKSSPIVSPRKLNPQVPKPLAAICLKAMARRKADRYASALALADDVKRYLAGEPVSAYREPIPQRAARWARRHRRGIATAAALLVIAILAAFGVAKDRENKRLAAREAARRDADLGWERADEFHRLADEARYFATTTKDADEKFPYHSWDQGRGAVSRALDIADDWGEQLENFPLEEARRHLLPAEFVAEAERRRQALRDDLYSLLLLDAQMALDPDRREAAAALQLLERARQLGPPTRQYYRLKAQASGEPTADIEGAPKSAWDYFLVGEEHRKGLKAPADAPGNSQQQAQNQTQLTEALEAYQTAIELDPYHFWSHYQLARCYLGLGRRAEALERLAVCIALRPEAPWTYSTRGLAFGLAGRLEEALEDFDQALEFEPQFLPARLNRGVAYYWNNEPQKALGEFNAVLDAPPERLLLEAAYYRGKLHLQANRLPEAQTDLSRVAHNRPQFRRVFLDLAELHLRQQQRQEVLDDVNAYLSIGKEGAIEPNGGEAYRLRGELLRRLAVSRNFLNFRGALLELARGELETAVAKEEKSARAWNELGAVYGLLGEGNQKILEVYATVLKLVTPDDEELLAATLEQRGWHYAGANQPDAAQMDFEQLLAKKSDRISWRYGVTAHCGLGYVYALKGSAEMASQHAREALQRLHKARAEDWLMRVNLACIYAKLAEGPEPSADRDHALSHLQIAIKQGGSLAERAIRNEPALKHLYGQPDFERLFLSAAPK